MGNDLATLCETKKQTISLPPQQPVAFAERPDSDAPPLPNWAASHVARTSSGRVIMSPSIVERREGESREPLHKDPKGGSDEARDGEPARAVQHLNNPRRRQAGGSDDIFVLDCCVHRDSYIGYAPAAGDLPPPSDANESLHQLLSRQKQELSEQSAQLQARKPALEDVETRQPGKQFDQKLTGMESGEKADAKWQSPVSARTVPVSPATRDQFHTRSSTVLHNIDSTGLDVQPHLSAENVNINQLFGAGDAEGLQPSAELHREVDQLLNRLEAKRRSGEMEPSLSELAGGEAQGQPDHSLPSDPGRPVSSQSSTVDLGIRMV